MINGSITGPRGNATFKYAVGPERTSWKLQHEGPGGVQRTVAGTSDGETDVLIRGRHNTNNGNGASHSVRNGPDGTDRLSTFSTPDATVYRMAHRDTNGELTGLWQGYLPGN